MTPVEVVLALRKKKSGNVWIAHCPFHADQNPSLSISVCDNARQTHVGDARGIPDWPAPLAWIKCLITQISLNRLPT
jgi:hypothetical protein